MLRYKQVHMALVNAISLHTNYCRKLEKAFQQAKNAVTT